MEAASIDGVGFLHVCGGDPEPICNTQVPHRFSPRMWR